MPHVITDTCTKDNLCYDSCPSEAIKPGQDEPVYASVPQLYISPVDCLDCGACVSVCPTNSIFAIEDLPADKAAAVETNAAYFN